jgi:putative tryptophan/tyrosine transport system substrate-binding protein
MRRREFIKWLGAAASGLALPAYAQTSDGLPLVAVLVPGPAEFAKLRVDAIRFGLQQAGLIEGKNYSFALRFANGDFTRLPALARELGALKPRVIVASATAATVAHQVLPDIPLVFTSYAADPIKAGFAASYVRPGGMATGNVMNAVGGEQSLTEKRIGLFKQLFPGLARLGMIGTDKNGLVVAEHNALTKVAADLGFEFVHYVIQTLDDLEGAVASGQRDGVSAFYVSGEPLLYNNMARVIPLVAASGKPTVGVYPEWARAGLLMAYSTDVLDDFRGAGGYAAKILGGTKPGDLPIVQASKFTFAINLKTASGLGIAVPPTLLSLADEVVE